MLMYRRTYILEVIGYSDADFSGCVASRKSMSGYIFKLADGAVSWRSVKQILTATSIWKPSSYLVLRLVRMVYG